MITMIYVMDEIIPLSHHSKYGRVVKPLIICYIAMENHHLLSSVIQLFLWPCSAMKQTTCVTLNPYQSPYNPMTDPH